MKRIIGFDYLRIGFSISVVIWHMGGLGKSGIFDITGLNTHTFELSDLLNFHILLLAVPSFILLSSYLFELRCQSTQYFINRLIKYTFLFVFWVFAINLFNHGINFYKDFINSMHSNAFLFILKGCRTIYYFFLCLIFTTIIAFFVMQIRKKIVFGLGIIYVIYVVCLPIYCIKFNIPILCSFYNPLNFWGYPIVAAIIKEINKKYSSSLKEIFLISIIFIAAGVSFSLYEWKYLCNTIFFQIQSFAFPAYIRMSSCLFSGALVLIFSQNLFKDNRLIHELSDNSIALYCLHPFIIRFSIIIPAIFPAFIWKCLQICMVITVCYSLRYVLLYIFNRRIFGFKQIGESY